MANRFKLKHLEDDREYPLEQRSLLIGRSSSCDIPVQVGHASREHARIIEKNGEVILEDLHSTNGTFVNNTRIHSATVLKPGDVIRFDEDAFTLQKEGEDDATVFARPDRGKAAKSVLVIEEEDEDDDDATAFYQSYVMPPGWSDFESDKGTPRDERKQQAIDRFLEKTLSAVQGKNGIALIFFAGDKPPVIKVLFSRGSECQWSIGRSTSSDVHVSEPGLSKDHANLKYKKNAWTLEDNNSTNGIWRDGKKQSAVTLNDDVVLDLGSVQLQVRIISAGKDKSCIS